MFDTDGPSSDLAPSSTLDGRRVRIIHLESHMELTGSTCDDLLSLTMLVVSDTGALVEHRLILVSEDIKGVRYVLREEPSVHDAETCGQEVQAILGRAGYRYDADGHASEPVGFQDIPMIVYGLIPLKDQDGWTAANDSQPTKDGWYLVVMATRPSTVVLSSFSDGRWVGPVVKPSHWRPLPAGPS